MAAMKRGLAGKTRRGAPPLTQQRRALRVVQLTFVGLAVVFGWWAWRALELRNSAGGSLGEATPSLSDVIGLGAVALLALAAAIVMGFRAVRGPEPPKI